MNGAAINSEMLEKQAKPHSEKSLETSPACNHNHCVYENVFVGEHNFSAICFRNTESTRRFFTIPPKNAGLNVVKTK